MSNSLTLNFNNATISQLSRILSPNLTAPELTNSNQTTTQSAPSSPQLNLQQLNPQQLSQLLTHQQSLLPILLALKSPQLLPLVQSLMMPRDPAQLAQWLKQRPEDQQLQQLMAQLTSEDTFSDVEQALIRLFSERRSSEQTPTHLHWQMNQPFAPHLPISVSVEPPPAQKPEQGWHLTLCYICQNGDSLYCKVGLKQTLSLHFQSESAALLERAKTHQQLLCDHLAKAGVQCQALQFSLQPKRNPSDNQPPHYLAKV